MLAALALLAAGGVTGTTAAGATTSACPSVNGQWAAPGPFAVSSASGRAGSAYQGKVDLANVGATGHSFRGGAAVDAGADSPGGHHRADLPSRVQQR
ncbi:hypothetical protein [Streptomyces sp. NPDC003032]